MCVVMLLVYAVNDSHGVPEDIADVVKDINDGMYSLNIDDGDGSLQLSVTQSQSVDGTDLLPKLRMFLCSYSSRMKG